jgi:hypothetical protein
MPSEVKKGISGTESRSKKPPGTQWVSEKNLLKRMSAIEKDSNKVQSMPKKR